VTHFIQDNSMRDKRGRRNEKVLFYDERDSIFV